MNTLINEDTPRKHGRPKKEEVSIERKPKRNKNTYIINGQEVMLFKIGDLCDRLERQRQTVCKWEKSGIIPQAQFRSKTGRRLYTKEQIDAIVETVNDFNLRQGCLIPEGFREAVYRAFAEASNDVQV
jgi:hypothetical protein